MDNITTNIWWNMRRFSDIIIKNNRKADMDMQYLTLSGGVTIPMLGYGTWQSPDDDTTSAAVVSALCDAGLRHIDCAAVYGNEKSVGRGIAESGIERSGLFITGKLWNSVRGYDNTIAACKRSISDLGVEYLDMYLIHWPRPKRYQDDYIARNAENWRAMEQLKKDGLVRAIGVSNFLPHHIDELMQTADEKPCIDQIEYHPGFGDRETTAYCRKNGIALEGYSPLGCGKVFAVDALKEIADAAGVSVAQLCIRWSIQKGVVTIPKSVTPERIKANADVFGFTISDDDMARIDAVTAAECPSSGNDPDALTF